MTVYLSEYIHPEAVSKLLAHATIVDTFDHPEEIDAIILRTVAVDASLIQKATRLKVIAKHGIGVNTIDVAAAKKNGVQVLFTPTTNADSVAEITVGLMLLLLRKLYEANVNCRAGRYTNIAPKALIGHELGGKTLGQIGMGNIGQRIAKILKLGFGVHALAYDPFVSAEEADRRGFEKVETLRELLERSDLVNINIPAMPGTIDLISGELFEHFKPGAVLINAARGGIVNEGELYQALVSGKIAAAACDTFVSEPPNGDNPLLSLSNFSATPHIGGNTEEALYRTGMEVVEETLNVLAGKAPLHPV